MGANSQLAPYPSPDARERWIEQLTVRCGGELIEYGRSVEGRALVAVRVPALDSVANDPPRVLCCAGIHGVEYVSTVLAGSLLEAAADPRLASLRERAEVWVAPCLNPDAYARTWVTGGRGRLADLRTNANGVDLNRNFPIPHGATTRRLPWAGSSRAGSVNYRGPHALSEPETASLDQLLGRVGFHASANLHSFMGTIIPARVTEPEAFAAYVELARAMARAQPRAKYRRLSNRRFDVFTGEQEDHQHHCHGTWAACIETFPVLASVRQHWRAPSLFWRFNPRSPQAWVDNDLPGIVAYFEHALTLPPAPVGLSPPTASA